jgi:uncharacterized protein YneF (UPF0154 family)
MDNYKEDLKHIRSMMERSSTFISLSGMSGIISGIIALAGAFTVFSFLVSSNIDYFDGKPNYYTISVIKVLILIGVITLALALITGAWFTIRNAKKKNLPLWTQTTKQIMIQIGIPLIAGGIFCLILVFNYNFYLVAPMMLLFYGIALVNVSKYTHPEIFWLGICEIILGLLGGIWVGYGLVFWAIGFGVLHIVYGALMYKKYDSK